MSEEITQTAPTTPTQESATTATTEATTVTDAGESTETVTTYMNGKYKSVSELEKGYENLHKRFGSFSGAPEEYSVSEEVEINNEHPLLANLQSFGKENQLSNEGYNELVNMLVENEKATLEAQKAQAEQTLKDLGPNANERIQNIDDFVNANLELSDETKGLIDLAKEQPGGVELIEAFIGMSKKTGPASDEVAAPAKSYSRDELHKLQFAKDEYGNRKMNDPHYRKMVDEYTANLLAQG
jgi:hypothetical protein